MDRTDALTACALLALLAGCRAPNFEDSAMSAEARAQWERAAPSPPPLVAALPVEAPLGPAAGDAPAAPAAPAFPRVFADPTPRALQLRGVPLDQALRLLAAQGGANLVLTGDFSPRVELELPEVPLQVALELLCEAHACRAELRDGLLLVRRDDPARVETRVFRVASIPAAAVQEELAAIVPDGSVVVNAARNVVMVTAPQPRLREVEAYLASIDRPDRQVLIEARILEVSRSELEELGTRIRYNDISVGDDTATFVSNLLTANQQVQATFVSADTDFDAAINALHSLAGLEVLARPRLLALNNREAKLELVTEIPYVNATTTTSGSVTDVGTQTIQEIEYKNVGLKLTLTPSVLEGGLIALTVDQEVSEQTGSFESVPIVDSRRITTAFVVGEGRTILIGGLLKERRNDTREGIPFLMDLPLLGQAFRNDTRDDDRTELILLMTPWLVSAEEGRALPPPAAG